MLFANNKARLFWHEADGFSSKRFSSGGAKPQKTYSPRETEQLVADLKNVHTEYWQKNYSAEEYGVSEYDATHWRLFLRYKGSRVVFYSGYDIYPETWEAFRALFKFELS
jgi:hypothetical protein